MSTNSSQSQKKQSVAALHQLVKNISGPEDGGTHPCRCSSGGFILGFFFSIYDPRFARIARRSPDSQLSPLFAKRPNLKRELRQKRRRPGGADKKNAPADPKAATPGRGHVRLQSKFLSDRTF